MFEFLLIYCSLVLLYVYVGYPLLAMMLGRWMKQDVQGHQSGSYLPSVSVLISAFNEAHVIRETVLNKLNQDYPKDLLEVIVVSDESNDGTDQVVQEIQDPRVRLIRQIPRQGKTAALNIAVPLARGEVIVFSDANSLYGGMTIKHLVAPLANSDVGYVTGRMVYKAPNGSLTGEGCSAFMRYENRLREYETRLGSIVGVDGGVDAMRRQLYTPLSPDQLPDFVQPLTVRQKGYRVVYEEKALLYEDALAETGDEFRMRVRVGLRAFHALKDKANLLNPFRYGLFAWQLFSHKLLRYMAFFFQLGVFFLNIAVVLDGTTHVFWRFILAGQAVFYGLALLGHFNSRKGGESPQIVSWVYYLCVVNLASAKAFLKFLQGTKQVTWNPRT